MHRSGGFTLIELVIVMVVISAGLVGITATFGNASKSLSTNEAVQRAAQYAQECAERALATRRDLGFAWFATNTFSCGGNPSGYTRTVAVGNIYTGPVSGACNGNNPCPCPSGITCRDVAIAVSNGLLSSSITVMLVNY